MLTVYIDGSCLKNPGGPGGWGIYIIHESGTASIFGSHPEPTTNNRMEMLAAIETLERIPPEVQLCIYTDSTYVHSGITKWIKSWKKKGWMHKGRLPSGNKAVVPVKNQDLWKPLDALAQGRIIDWRWVRGHAFNYENEKADELAKMGTRLAQAGKKESVHIGLTIEELVKAIKPGAFSQARTPNFRGYVGPSPELRE